MNLFLLKQKVILLFLLMSANFLVAQTIVFEERFNSISGTGGNSGGWNGNIATREVQPDDLVGWELTKAFKADKCIKVGGARSNQGIVTTPALSGLNGNAFLTFRAGAWDANSEKTILYLEINNGGSLSQQEVTLNKGNFDFYTVGITGGTPQSKITFKGDNTGSSRFFLDDVVVNLGDVAVDPPVQDPVVPDPVVPDPVVPDPVVPDPIISISNSCRITETFENFEYSGSRYLSGSFVGVNGIVWEYTEARDQNNDANNSGIQGKAIMLQKGTSEIVSDPIANGIGSFYVKLYKGFTGRGNRQVELFINDQSIVVSDGFDDNEMHALVVENINIEGEVVIKIKNKTGRQVILDDISWTCYGESIKVWDGNEWLPEEPSVNNDIIIQGDFVTSNDLYDIKSISLYNDATFTINQGNTVYAGDINSSGGTFVISDGASLIQPDGANNSGNVTVIKKTVPLKRLDYMLLGTPVSNQNLFAFSPNTLTNRFYYYDTANDQYSNEGFTSDKLFEKGRAYGIRTPNNFTSTPQIFEGVYEGVLNTGDFLLDINHVGENFNLLGNPYPSLLDLDVFFDMNPQLDKTAYFYINANDFDEEDQSYFGYNYATYNKSGNSTADNSEYLPTNIVSVAEGFIVKTNSNTPVYYNNNMRVGTHSGTSPKASLETEKDRFWLRLTDDGFVSNNSLIAYIEGATNSEDRSYDAVQLPQNVTSLTSLINGKAYTIQGRSYPLVEDDEVFLRLDAKKAANYQISLTKKEGVFNREQQVYLKDRYTGVVFELGEESYSFSSEPGVFDNRFSIVYKNIPLSVVDNNFLEESIVLFQKDKNIIIDSSTQKIVSVRIVDVKGRVVYKTNLAAVNYVEIGYESFSKGVYFVQIETENGNKLIKKVVL